MIMADILKILLLIVGYLLIYISYWLLSQALFPELVAKARSQYARPFRTTLIGLVTAAPLIIVGIIIMSVPNPAVKIVGGIIAGIPVMFGLAGSTGLCQRIGMGLPSPLDEAQPWRRVLRGGIVLTFTFLLPFIGWFVVPIWILISGCGALVISLRSNRGSSVENKGSVLLEPAREVAH
jgi:hypothetical protein